MKLTHVYDFKQKNSILCGKNDNGFGINAFNGEVVFNKLKIASLLFITLFSLLPNKVNYLKLFFSVRNSQTWKLLLLIHSCPRIDGTRCPLLDGRKVQLLI